LFWGEQQPFVSSGCGGLYFFAMQRKGISWPLAFVLGIAIVALAAYSIVDRITSLPGKAISSLARTSAEQAKQIRDAFAELFELQPRISVQNNIVYEQSKSIFELSVVSQDTEITHEYDQTWLGSTKRIRIHATYRVKAGFDLNEGFTVNIEEQDISIRTPPARILSVEPEKITVEELRDGLWNKIQPQDVQTQLAVLPDLARSNEAALPAEAEQTFKQMISSRLPNLNIKIEPHSASGGAPE
jgi:hypothetical protein